MRRKDEQQLEVFSYVSPEQRVPQDHPLPSLRFMTDEALRELQPRFNKLYAETGRPSIAPEKLLRALLLQALYSVRSEIDAHTTQHVGYAISQRKRKRIEECVGWLKTIALLRKVRHRGIFKVGWTFTFAAAAYKLVRMRNLVIQAA